MPTKTRTYLGTTFGLEQRTLIQADNKSGADDCLNVQIRRDNGLEKRKGYQAVVSNTGGYGIAEYTYLNSDNTLSTEKLLLGESLHRLVQGSFAITYSGAFPQATVQLINSSGQLKLQLIEDGSTVLNYALGQGFEESSTITIANAKTAVDAISGFSSTITGTTSIPAAFLDITPATTISNGRSYVIKFLYTEEVNKTVDKPFDGLLSIKNTDNLHNIQYVNHNNTLILTDGSYPKVYDGHTVYKAGLPQPSVPIITHIPSGSLNNDYIYYLTYEFTDARGKRTESNLSEVLEVTATNENLELAIETLYQDSGYNTNCAIVNGAQTVASSGGTVTLNVNDGIASAHTLKAGDTALLFNSDSSVNDLVTYPVASVTASTVVLTTTDTITVADKDVISNNLQINIYREDGVSDTVILIKSLPNNSFEHFIKYTDSLADSSLNPIFTEFETPQGPPPLADYCTSYKGNLIFAKGQTLYFSDEVNNGTITSSLSFPVTNFILFKDPITALAVNGSSLVIFGRKSIYTVIGQSLDLDTVNIILVTEHIGCLSANSIVPVGSMLYFTHTAGIYAISNGTLLTNDLGIPVPVSSPINAWFKTLRKDGPFNLKLERSVGLNDIYNNRYILFIPSESESNLDFSNNASICLVQDYQNSQWFIWNNMNMAGGALLDIFGNLYWTERQESKSQRVNTCRQLNLKTADDYWDHTTAISAFYEFKWDTLDSKDALSTDFNLTTYKKPLNVKLYSVKQTPEDFLHNANITVTTFKDYVPQLFHSQSVYSFDTQGEKYPHRWQSKPFGSWREGYKKQKLTSELVEAVKFRIENNDGGVNFNLSALEIEWAQPFDKQLKT